MDLFVGNITLPEPGEIILQQRLYFRPQPPVGRIRGNWKVIRHLRERAGARTPTFMDSAPPMLMPIISWFLVPRFSQVIAFTSSSLSVRRVLTAASRRVRP